MYAKIETDRLRIKPISTSDKKFIHLLTNTDGWLTFIGDRNIKNELDAEIYIKRIIDNDNFFYNIIELKMTNQPIGLITFLKRTDQEYPDLGFALLPQFEKKGYTFEASKKYLEHIESVGTYDIILGITKSNNLKSINLLTKLGFTFKTKEVKEDEQIIEIYKKTKNR